MKLDKLIKKLQNTFERHGNIDVHKNWEWYEEDMVGSTNESVQGLKVETRFDVLENAKVKVVIVR
tara:strand:+ start:6030 stop:6224 length:195 start_codon:yes stop_codon:yes gene_type:complete